MKRMQSPPPQLAQRSWKLFGRKKNGTCIICLVIFVCFSFFLKKGGQHAQKKMENQSGHAVDEAVFQELHVYK